MVLCCYHFHYHYRNLGFQALKMYSKAEAELNSLLVENDLSANEMEFAQWKSSVIQHAKGLIRYFKIMPVSSIKVSCYSASYI